MGIDASSYISGWRGICGSIIRTASASWPLGGRHIYRYGSSGIRSCLVLKDKGGALYITLHLA